MSSAGWYTDPTRRHRYRWWAGRWTDHVADGPTPGRDPLKRTSRRVLGWALLGQLAAAPFIGFLVIGGDPYPISRAGVTNLSGRVQIVNAVCPEERLRSIELRRRPAAESGEAPLLWRVSGDAAVPTTVAIGAAVPGLRTDVPLIRPLEVTDRLTLRVVTSELDSPYSLEFTVDEVPARGVLSYGEMFGTDGEFRAAVLRETPCGDPYRKEAPGRFLGRVLLVQLAGFLIGLVLTLTPRYRPPTDRP